MGVKYVNPDVLDRGLNEVKNNASVMALISSFSVGDSYAVVSGRKLAEVVMNPADFVLGPFGTNERKIDVATKNATATTSSTATPDLHIALLDGNTNRVLVVADETSDQAITSGNPITFPAWEIRGRQPV
jgi:hypothetical protein